MSKSLEILPIELQRIIFEYAFKCKKEQNFYINKELFLLITRQIERCENRLIFNMSLCRNCDSIAFDWFSYMGCSLV
jgi:hypothetical protein